jgi:hypothetical protein
MKFFSSDFVMGYIAGFAIATVVWLVTVVWLAVLIK